jgi:hypothetical protein
MDTEESNELNLGAIGGGLRYWRAKEAVRQAELTLSSQADSRRGFEARTTALLGWIVAGTSLLIAASASVPPARALAALAAMVPLFAAGGVAVAVLWPGMWGHAGYSPLVIMDGGLSSELEEIESIAGGYENAIALNERWLRRAMVLTRWVYCLFAATPIAGTASFVAAALVI